MVEVLAIQLIGDLASLVGWRHRRRFARDTVCPECHQKWSLILCRVHDHGR
jgi:hypothetical protein